ncbi:E3 ubiquitin-protein ligase BRE1-like 2 isoform X3 [Brachypodium distachyon]|uniref:E3 ubiquitin-protein ligase BRE1-like 2 isoform X3 n=1 Tax=Brachypodium distachyon TaxID=15368 RepID=UPI000D0D4DE9|nr:E3 ubiquitin-protein ligase BRE1-like 2 isoform X3 [Brachypodium distachyon]|eukprot:XP_024315126.1 E3 ubiquitin-protein ligase BRE1-like 2 isoform X3 [Brachypodium distachyon]
MDESQMKVDSNVIVALQNHNDHLKEVVANVHEAISIVNGKHKKYLDEIEALKNSYPKELEKIKRLSGLQVGWAGPARIATVRLLGMFISVRIRWDAIPQGYVGLAFSAHLYCIIPSTHISIFSDRICTGELEKTMEDLEESRPKLVVLQLQRHGGSLMNISGPNATNGATLTAKSSDKSMGWPDLKDAVDEAKTLATNRLFELHETQEDNLILSRQLEDLQGQLKDDNYIFTSKPYTILSDQLRHLNTEIERYRGLVEVLQNDKNQFMQREKEMCAKGESVDSIRQSITTHEARIEELEHQILKSIAEKNEIEIKVEETLQDSGKKDFKDEIHVMAAALSKEMEMMENQLNRSKDAASEAHALREEAKSLRTLLVKKTDEQKEISDRYNTQVIEIKSLKALIETLDQEKQELEFIVDMYAKESSDSRTIADIKESESRAHKQAEYLRTSLEEHSLELRVKAANEAETACQRRLSIAEAELEELRTKVDACERDVLELNEAIRIKEAEGDAYISEIETIGQAYEDMQTQNQHLLQQVADRDDFNIKLVSDSVKTKQASASLLSEKHLLQKQLLQVNSSLESYEQKVARGEEQMKAYVEQAVRTSSENRHHVINIERTMLEVSDAEKELKWLRSSIGSSEKEYELNQKRIAELRMELERERSERMKLEEEYEEVKNEVMELTSENEETTIQKLQDEIKECKAILKCGVCFDRPKEVVITKCFHLFCSPCIQRNLELRHRKCPGCGTPFGQNDVREVKI